jgi:hypothetical protein
MALKVRDLVARLRVIMDRRAAKQAEDEVKGAFSGIEAMAKRVGAAIASAFAVTAVLAFAKVSIQAAIEAERVWNKLSGTLASAGVEFSKVEGRIRAGARAMKEAAGVGDDEYAATLGRLVSLTGDFTLSLSQMGLVADVAARFFGGDLAPAVDLVGRALNGQTRSLREVGIVTKDVNEGLRILRERSSGAAENELRTLDGRLRQLKDSAGEVREEFGFLILRVFGGGDTEIAVNRFRLGLDRIADALSRIKRIEFRGFKFAGAFPVPTFGLGRTPAETPAGKDPTEGIAQLDPIIGLAKIGGRDTDSESAATRAAELRAMRLMREARIAADRRNRESERLGFQTSEGMGPVGSTFFDGKIPPPDTSAIDQWMDTWGQIESAAVNASMGISGAFQDTFSLIISGSANIGDVMEEMARGIAGALIGGIAEYAAVESGKEVAAGIGKLAAGTWPPNPAAIAAAGMHFKSAGLWGILAGLAGAGQSAIAGGGRGGQSGGIPSGAADIGGRIAQRAEAAGAEIHVHFVGPGFDAVNPEVQRVVAGAVQNAQERVGNNAKVYTHRRSA